MSKPKKKTDESYLVSDTMTQQEKDLIEHWDNGYNQACDEWERWLDTPEAVWKGKYNLITLKSIKALLLANNNWFYDYLEARISIGKLMDNIAQAIIKELTKGE